MQIAPGLRRECGRVRQRGDPLLLLDQDWEQGPDWVGVSEHPGPKQSSVSQRASSLRAGSSRWWAGHWR